MRRGALLRSVLVFGGLAGACASVTGLSDYAIDDPPRDAAVTVDGPSSGGEGGPSSSSSGASTSSSSSSGADAAVEAESGSTDLPAATFAASYCGFFRRCLPALASALDASESDCRTRVTTGSTTDESFRPQFAACAKKLDAADCHARAEDFPECTFRGALGGGKPCIGGAQCESGYCSGVSSNQCGTCKDLGAVGATCTDSRDCKPELMCSPLSNPKKCAKRQPEGEICATDLCEPGLVCVQSVCRKGAAKGEACTVTPQGECRSALYCNADKTCVEYAYAPVGGSCKQTVPTVCSSSACVKEKCTAFAKLGAECSADGEKGACDPSLAQTCVNAKCAYTFPATCP